MDVRLHDGPFAVPCCGAVEDKKAFFRDVARHTVPHSLLQKDRFVHVLLHSGGNGILPQLGLCLGVVFYPGHHGKHIRRRVGPELAGPQVKRPIEAVEQERVTVKCRNLHWVHAGGVLQDRLPIAAPLPAPYKFQISLPLLFIFQGQRINGELVGQAFAHLHYTQIADIRIPGFSVVHEPFLSFRYIAGLVLVPVRKQISVADVVPAIAPVVFWVQIRQGHTARLKPIGSRDILRCQGLLQIYRLRIFNRLQDQSCRPGSLLYVKIAGVFGPQVLTAPQLYLVPETTPLQALERFLHEGLATPVRLLMDVQGKSLEHRGLFGLEGGRPWHTDSWKSQIPESLRIAFPFYQDGPAFFSDLRQLPEAVQGGLHTLVPPKRLVSVSLPVSNHLT